MRYRYENIKTNLPGFEHLRRKIYKEKLPDIQIETAFKNRNAGEVEVVSGTLVKEKPRKTHEKLYEIDSVQVSTLYIFGH